MGLQQWRVGFIIGLLPVLMSASLCILVGRVVFLVPLQASIPSVIGSITFISFAAYFITNLLPIIYPSCPYKTPLSQYIFPLYTYISHNSCFTSAISPFSRYWPELFTPFPEKPPIRALRDAERAAVEDSAYEMEANALSWLFCMSSNPSVQSIVVEAVSVLPLNSVSSLKHYSKGISEMCHTLINGMRDRVEERKLDRLIRTHLRLQSAQIDFILSGMLQVERGRFSSGVYAELLSIQSSHLEEIENLIKAQFTNNDLCLQPIVWGNLLRRILPCSLSLWSTANGLVQWLFHAIPVAYWRIGNTPPLFMTSNGLKICLIPEQGHQAVSLWTAVNKYLYPYVADIILESHVHATDSVYHYGPVDEFPEPKDPRLRSLLTIAGSPSIQRCYGSVTDVDSLFRSAIRRPPLLMIAGSRTVQRRHSSVTEVDSLFRSVIRSVGAYVAVDSSPLYGVIPSFNLDGNRYAALKLLYTLVSSNEFGGDASIRLQDLHITLVIFLRVLNSTSPRPRFLPEDWCTPTMAANFVRIAFQDDAWVSQYEPAHGYNSRLSAAVELVHYFLRFPPVMKEAFFHFVSKRLLGPIASLRGYGFSSNAGLSMILKAFITGLESDVLNPEILQQSMEYLFEPENLFTVCAVLLVQDKPHSLRCLALLRPNDPAWPDCLKKLDTFPTHFDVMYFPVTISDFRAFLEGGCVGVYGIGMTDPQTKRRDHDGSCRPEDLLSRIKLWLNQLWPRRGTNEGDVRCSGDGQV